MLMQPATESTSTLELRRIYRPLRTDDATDADGVHIGRRETIPNRRRLTARRKAFSTRTQVGMIDAWQPAPSVETLLISVATTARLHTCSAKRPSR